MEQRARQPVESPGHGREPRDPTLEIAVPEPSAALLIALGLLAGVRSRRGEG